MLAFRDETEEQELWVAMKCKPGTEVLASTTQGQWWHLQSSKSVVIPKGSCSTVIINCHQIQFLKLCRPLSLFKINQDIIVPALKKSVIPRYSAEIFFFIPCLFKRNIKTLHLMCLLQPRRWCLSILIVIQFFTFLLRTAYFIVAESQDLPLEGGC